MHINETLQIFYIFQLLSAVEESNASESLAYIAPMEYFYFR